MNWVRNMDEIEFDEWFAPLDGFCVRNDTIGGKYRVLLIEFDKSGEVSYGREIGRCLDLKSAFYACSLLNGDTSLE